MALDKHQERKLEPSSNEGSIQTHKSRKEDSFIKHIWKEIKVGALVNGTKHSDSQIRETNSSLIQSIYGRKSSLQVTLRQSRKEINQSPSKISITYSHYLWLRQIPWVTIKSSSRSKEVILLPIKTFQDLIIRKKTWEEARNFTWSSHTIFFLTKLL